MKEDVASLINYLEILIGRDLEDTDEFWLNNAIDALKKTSFYKDGEVVNKYEILWALTDRPGVTYTDLMRKCRELGVDVFEGRG